MHETEGKKGRECAYPQEEITKGIGNENAAVPARLGPKPGFARPYRVFVRRGSGLAWRVTYDTHVHYIVVPIVTHLSNSQGTHVLYED